MKEEYDNLWMTFCEKNHDYGSSFEQSLDKHGLLAGVVRMEDKINRISTLVDVDKHAKIASESLADTLRDLSNYSAMAACWLDGPDDVYNEEYARQYSKLSTIMRNSTYGVEDLESGGIRAFYKPGDVVGIREFRKQDDISDEEPTESGQFSGLKVYDKHVKWGDDIAEGFSGSVVTTMGREEFEKVKDAFHLSSFEGHQEKVNERAHYESDDISDDEIIKNWSIVGDEGDVIRSSYSIRSRTTGQYLVEDDDPELFRKILGVLKAHKYHKNFMSALTPAPEDIVNESQPLETELKGLENGYFIRQHINSDNSYRYTIAFNPEGTIKTQNGEEKPYVIECFGNDYDGMNVWAIHVFDTLEDMVYALDYDLRVRNALKSKNLGDSIKGLNIEVSVYAQHDAPLVFETWCETFGQAFDKQMTSKGLDIEKYFELYQGIKTFGPVFISEKTGALIVKGNIREASFKRSCDFIWFSDTKEVLLEVDDTTPKFNYDGVLYGVIYTYEDNEYIDINPLYENMDMKIMSRFYSCSVSELKNLVFFNEDTALNSGNLSSKNGIY